VSATAISHAHAAQGATHWTVESILTRMDAAGKSFKSLTADLEHIKYTAVVKDTSTETGRIFVRRDEKMRIEITAPDKRTILRSGDSLFVYTPKINSVEEYNLGKNRAMVDQYVLLGFGTKSENVKKNYDVQLVGEDKLDQRNTLILELVPKSASIRGHMAEHDDYFPPAAARALEAKLRAMGKQVTLTVHPGTGHASWDRTTPWGR